MSWVLVVKYPFSNLIVYKKMKVEEIVVKRMPQLVKKIRKGSFANITCYRVKIQRNTKELILKTAKIFLLAHEADSNVL